MKKEVRRLLAGPLVLLSVFLLAVTADRSWAQIPANTSASSSDAPRSVVDFPAELALSVQLSFPDPSRSSSYRLVGLAGDVDLPISETLSGSAPADWRAFRDDGSTEDGLREYDGSGAFDFRPGRGFWLLSTGTWTVDETVPPVALTDGVYEIPVHAGWNIISNPFDVNLDWSAVRDASDIGLQTLWRFNGSFRQTNTFASGLQGEAFYVYAEEAGAVRLTYPEASPAQGSEDNPETTSFDSLRLTAYAGAPDAPHASTVEIGRAFPGETLRDRRLLAPPVSFEAVSLRIEPAETEDSGRKLAREVRSEFGAGQRFDLQLRIAPDNTEPVITFEASGLSEWLGFDVVLFDHLTGRSFDLRANPSPRLSALDGSTRQLTLLVGTPRFIRTEHERLAPSSTSLLGAYPTPFRSETTIEYTLAEPSAVQLSVFNVLGREVRVLDESEQAAGRHELRWDGRDASGTSLPSGVYLVRLRTAKATQTTRVVLVR